MDREVCVTKDYFIDYVDVSDPKTRTCQPLNLVIKHITLSSITDEGPWLTAADLAQILTMDAEDVSDKIIFARQSKNLKDE